MTRLAGCALLLFGLAAHAQQRQGSAPPKPAPAKPAAKAAGPAALPSALKYPPLRPIQVPKVETFTLPNGMRLYLLEDHELPLVNGAARVRTGNLFDPPDKVGLAGITGTVMRSGGTRDKTGDELDRILENMAASVEAGIGETSGSVSFSALKENTDAVLAVFTSVLTAPEFRQDKIDLARTQARSAISRRNDDAHGIVQREFSDLVYGKDTPYGWRTEYATIDAIQRSDLQAFYRRYFFPANVMLAVWGDFNAAEMKARLERLFAGWTVKQEPAPPFPKVEAAFSPGAYLAVKEDVTQTFFTIGHRGGELRDKDYPALEVMADILGGGFKSRLMQRVRSRMGAAYSISAHWGANYGHPGLFQIGGSTKSLSTLETIRAVQQEVARMRTSEVSQEELDTAKQSTLNSLVFAFDTKAKTLGRLLTYEYWGYPKDFIQRYQKALEGVTRADVLRVAKQYLDPARFVIMTVGNPAEFGAGLETLGVPLKPVDLSIARGRAKVDSSLLERGRKLLAEAQQAAGGREKILAVRDVVQKVDFKMDPAAGGMAAKQTNTWLAPDSIRQDNELPIGKISAYYDGKSGWLRTPQGTMPLAGPQLKQVQGEVFRNYFRLLAAERYGYEVSLSSGSQLTFRGADGQEVRVTFDDNTGLVAGVAYEMTNPVGPLVTVENRYSDYRPVDGIQTPFKMTIIQDGKTFAEAAVTECRINTGVKPEELSGKPQ
jgi:zinc protease